MTKDELTEIFTNIECITCSTAMSSTILDPKDIKEAVDEIWEEMEELRKGANV